MIIRIAIAIAAILTMTGCSVSQKVNTFVKNNCECTERTNPFTKQTFTQCVCDSLYDASKVSDKCKVASVTFDASKATIKANVNCADGKEQLYEALKEMVKGIIGKYKSSKK